MIELQNDSLVFSFPEVHPSATVRIDFQRTLRIPDDGRDYPLPPGLGRFPLRHVDDVDGRVPPAWIERGGVLLPMYQSEALWLSFSADHDDERKAAYPFALKIAAGKINAVSGEPWSAGLHRRPRQDYVGLPVQPWLDGYCIAQGVIRQFVAMPLGAGYTAEEQITGRADVGGLQVMAFPMKRAAFERHFPKRPPRRECVRDRRSDLLFSVAPDAMGLAPGGRMRQEIFNDPFSLADWDLAHGSRCFVHIANSLVWRQVTGEEPPTTPPTATEYARAGVPWFEWYDDQHAALNGSAELAGLKSVAAMGKKKGDVPLPENETVTPERIIALRRGLTKDQVREFAE